MELPCSFEGAPSLLTADAWQEMQRVVGSAKKSYRARAVAEWQSM
jgi:hypothetical protein